MEGSLILRNIFCFYPSLSTSLTHEEWSYNMIVIKHLKNGDITLPTCCKFVQAELQLRIVPCFSFGQLALVFV